MTATDAPAAAVVRTWLADVVDPALLGADDAALTDLGWDSLTLTEVVVAAEEELGTVLPEELLLELRTLGDVVHYLATTAGRRTDDDGGIELVPVTAADEPMLLDWFTAPGSFQRFRLRGQTPSPEAFHRLLWDAVLCQFLVCRADRVPVGLVSCFEADLRNRYANLAALANPAVPTATGMPRGLAAFVTHLFRTFELRKLYAHMLERSYAQVASGDGRLFHIEGRLIDHEYVDGRYEDLVLLAVHRDDWLASRHWG